MTYFQLETIAAPLASLVAFFGLSARRTEAPTLIPAPAAPVATRVGQEPVAAAPVASSVYPEYGADSNCGWMTGAIAAFRAF